MKIVLAKPCWEYPRGESESTYNRVWMPLELANCAAVLRAEGHDVSIVDAQALRLPPDRLAARCAGAGLVILTSSGLDRWQCPYNEPAPFIAASREMKNAGLAVAVTGFHGTFNPAAVLRLTGCRAVIRGEPEGTVAGLAAAFATAAADGRRVDLSGVPGVSYLAGERVNANPDCEPLDLSRLPVPAFDLFETRRYFYEILGGDFILLEATRGCPYQCTFCSKVMYGTRFRRKSPQQVAAEIDYALERTSARSAYFMDLEFTVARELAISICRHLIERGAPWKWCCQTRADNVDAELLALMRRAGCRLIHLGVESGSERILSQSGKATSKAEILQGARLMRHAGIETLAFFMFGLPGETDAEREETIAFARELDPTYASFHFATPYPGSDLFRTLGVDMGDDLAFPLVAPSEDLAVLKGWVSRGVREFYLRPSYIARHILRGGPSHWWRQARLFLSYMR